MRWHDDRLYVTGVERKQRDDRQMEENLKALLDMYDAHGRGWYLVGWYDEVMEEDELDPFNPISYNGSAPSCYCWLPNPFKMHPGLIAVKVRRASDLIYVAYLGWDDRADLFAYAGDGDEPLEHMVIRGEEFDMRERSAA